MAIYRPPRSPWRARILVALAGLVIGGILVLLFLPEGEPSPEERAATVRTELVAAEGALEIVAIEYAESVEDGEVVAEAEYEGALSALARSRARYSAVKDEIEADVAGIDTQYESVEALMDERAPDDRLTEALDRLSQMLTEAAL
ncbi:MAG TPA: hypothetical protein VE174_06555 [Actinomycetota bacterium]|nr:hypothetical protein [Actinomycetota bacterium]